MTTRSSFARTDSGRSRRQKREKTKVKKSSISPQHKERLKFRRYMNLYILALNAAENSTASPGLYGR
jgi:hypothetical protein